ncbi:MAG: hypothetical protein R3D44_10800 [Hyphomicrobiaceae bacterium]
MSPRQVQGPRDTLVYRLQRVGREWRIEHWRKRIDRQGGEFDWDL